MDLFNQEQNILALSMNGQPEMFALIVRRHQQRVRSSLYRWTRGNGALVDDLAQETFLKAFKNAAAYSGTGSLIGWLLKIAHNEFLQYLRKQKDTNLEFEIEDEEQIDPERNIVARTTVEFALAKLPLRQRQAIDLCLVNGFTYDEAAEIIDKPAGTIKSDVSRAKDSLRHILSAEG